MGAANAAAAALMAEGDGGGSGRARAVDKGSRGAVHFVARHTYGSWNSWRQRARALGVPVLHTFWGAFVDLLKIL
jgi:hypothetical protein